ncbi:MAG TPA: hypothetical protein VLB80_02345 [Candidatus Babeliales bacterium]|nr:hypothetical protein [Candidatus Babeliales bacterium]
MNMKYIMLSAFMISAVFASSVMVAEVPLMSLDFLDKAASVIVVGTAGATAGCIVVGQKGAALGATYGARLGSIAGPAGALAGGVIGVVGGGAVGAVAGYTGLVIFKALHNEIKKITLKLSIFRSIFMLFDLFSICDMIYGKC